MITEDIRKPASFGVFVIRSSSVDMQTFAPLGSVKEFKHGTQLSARPEWWARFPDYFYRLQGREGEAHASVEGAACTIGRA